MIYLFLKKNVFAIFLLYILQKRWNNISILRKYITKEGSVKLRKIYDLNYKILLKLSTEHNIKVEPTITLSLS